MRAGAVKYKFGAGDVKYKLGSGARARAGGRETQVPVNNRKKQTDVNNVVLVSLLLNLNRAHTLSFCFHWKLWKGKFRLRPLMSPKWDCVIFKSLTSKQISSSQIVKGVSKFQGINSFLVSYEKDTYTQNIVAESYI